MFRGFIPSSSTGDESDDGEHTPVPEGWPRDLRRGWTHGPQGERSSPHVKMASDSPACVDVTRVPLDQLKQMALDVKKEAELSRDQRRLALAQKLSAELRIRSYLLFKRARDWCDSFEAKLARTQKAVRLQGGTIPRCERTIHSPSPTLKRKQEHRGGSPPTLQRRRPSVLGSAGRSAQNVRTPLVWRPSTKQLRWLHP